jgi:hypothetical protein
MGRVEDRLTEDEFIADKIKKKGFWKREIMPLFAKDRIILDDGQPSLRSWSDDDFDDSRLTVTLSCDLFSCF